MNNELTIKTSNNFAEVNRQVERITTLLETSYYKHMHSLIVSLYKKERWKNNKEQ